MLIEDNEPIDYDFVSPDVREDIHNFCNTYTNSDIMRLFRLMGRIDICIPRSGVTANCGKRYVNAVFEPHLLPLPWDVAVLPTVQELEDDEAVAWAMRYFFQYANSCLMTETGSDYISHSFDGSDTRRTVLGCPVGYALVVTDRDISTAITVPEAWLCVAPGSVTKSDTSAMSLNVTIPHLEIALAAWEASFNADVERTKELGNAVEIWERFWTPDRQRDVQTIADLRKLSNSDTVIVLRIVAASGDRVFKLKRSLGNARTEFFMAASNNSTGFFVVAPDLADPYREPLRETLFLYDAD